MAHFVLHTTSGEVLDFDGHCHWVDHIGNNADILIFRGRSMGQVYCMIPKERVMLIESVKEKENAESAGQGDPKTRNGTLPCGTETKRNGYGDF